MSGFLRLFQPSWFNAMYFVIDWAQRHLCGVLGSREQNRGFTEKPLELEI